MSHASASLKGDLLARLDTQEIEASGLLCSVRGKIHEQNIAMTLDAGKLVAQAKRARAENVLAALEMQQTSGPIALKIAAPSATFENARARMPATAIDISLTRGEHHVRAAVSAGVEANTAAHTLALTDMRSTFDASGPGLPRERITGAAAGSARIDAAGENVQLSVTGTVGESKVQAHLKATGFATPVYAFDVAIDQLDVDRYLRDLAEPRRKIARSEDASVFEPLAQLRATGTVTVGRLRSAGVNARNVRFDLK
jgi:AsmA protein